MISSRERKPEVTFKNIGLDHLSYKISHSNIIARYFDGENVINTKMFNFFLSLDFIHFFAVFSIVSRTDIDFIFQIVIFKWLTGYRYRDYIRGMF